MLNLLHMDLHRMGRSASTWVILGLTVLVALFCVAMTAGDIQDMADDPQYLAEIQGEGSDSENRSVGIYVEADANWIDGPIEAGDIVSAELHSGLLALLGVVFTAMFVYAEEKNGYGKNIAGQFPNRGLLALSKFLAVALQLLGMTVLFALALCLFGRVFWGERFYLDSLPALGKLLAAQYLLHLGLCALVLLFTILLHSAALPMVVGILACCGVFMPVYGMVNQVLDQRFPGFDLSQYMLDGNLTALTVGSTSGDLLRGGLVGAVFAVVCTALAMVLQQKRDVK